MIEKSRESRASGVKSWSLAVSSSGKMGVGLRPGGGNESTCRVEWKSDRALSLTRGTAQLEHWVTGAELLQPTRGGGPTLIGVQVESYPSVQTCGFGPSGPLPRMLPLHPMTSVLT